MERLYGIVLGGEYSASGHTLRRFDCYPSQELLGDLKALPQDSVIAIEALDPNSGTRRISSFRYWGEIERAARDAGLDVRYLEDPLIVQTYRDALGEKARVNRQATRRAEMLLAGGRLSDLATFRKDTKLRELIELAYAIEATANYQYLTLARERILVLLAQIDPVVAIISQAHADYFALNPHLLHEKGVYLSPVFEYLREEGVAGERSRLEMDSRPYPFVSIQIESLARQYRAVTEGRVLPNQTPDFIGTWDLDCRPAGLFEVFVAEGKSPDDLAFSGTIEDKNGTATFSGLKREEEYISFRKFYIPGKSLSDLEVYHGAIVYEGVYRGGRYEGEYHAPDTHGRFVMNRSSKLVA